MAVSAGLCQGKELPFRRFVGPEFLGHRFIDDRHFRRFLAVGLRENATGLESDLQSFEVAGSDGVEHDRGRLLANFSSTAVRNHQAVGGDNPHGNGEGLCCGHHSRQSRDALIQLSKEFFTLRRIQPGLLHIHR